MEVIKFRRLLVIYVTLVVFTMALLPTSRSAITFGNETDRLSLVAFKGRVTGDPFGTLSSWNDSFHHCNWIGITCSRRHPGRVTVLNLVSQSLVGSISPHVGNLTFLKLFALSNHSLNGKIPQEIGHLRRLRFLFLSNNSLTGEIPNNLTSCTELRVFFAKRNELVGRIPIQLGSLSKLVILEISANYLEGTIPVSLSNISTLETLSLASNNLSGNIPSDIGKLSRLQFFQISVNNISGTIPPQLYNISSIYYFSVLNNRLHGTIPPYIGNTLPNLEMLGLGGNMFSGWLPNSISNLSRLQVLHVPKNQFTGRVPPNLGFLQGLTTFSMGVNQLGTGEADELNFFDSLTNCSRLEFLGIMANNFTGPLPDSIANLSTTLTKLYVGMNPISGEIPAGIDNLVSLNGLDMEDNLLTGSIPVSIGNLPNLVFVIMSGNQLSGQIPPNICNNSAQLEGIYFQENRLEGEIPLTLSNCRKLTSLNLTQNQLSGSITKPLMGLSSLLLILALSRNFLTGTLPSEIGNFEKIFHLRLSENQLSGQIPSSLDKCLYLETLHLQGNLFEGSIPPSLKTLKGMRVLDVSRNRLSGRIPDYLETFASLRYLNLSSNDFEGEVPKQGIFKSTSAFSIAGNKKLCGGISSLQLPSCPIEGPKKQVENSSLKRLLLIIFGAVIFAIFLGLSCIFFWRRRLAKTAKTLHSSESSIDLDGRFQKVSYKELLKATNEFSAENLVGVGSYSSVYKGLLTLSQDITATIVAVKVLDLKRRGAAECEALRCIRHRNLVKIYTSCSSVDFRGNEFKALVFEFMPNGSLENWLHPTTANYIEFQITLGRSSLSFMERLNVAIDVASALDYLHHHCQTPIVHCDLKPSNVLLDDFMNAHVGDFGLAKFLGGVITNVKSEYHTNSTSIGIRGSVGYVAPEYGMGSEVSTKGDVYSFGIMLLEMFTGRRPTDDMFEDGFTLHSFAMAALATGEAEAKMSKAMTGVLKLGVGCSNDTPTERLEMVQVVNVLQSIKNMYLLDLDTEP